MKKRKIVKWIIAGVVLISLFIFFSRGMNNAIPAEEQEFIDTTLVKITSESTLENVIELLGEPSRDLGLKVNWKITFNGKTCRIGVYFSADTAKATTLILDGGVGRFYYKKDLDN